MAQNSRIHPDAFEVDPSLGTLPTLIVPDDPVNGVIERPKTPEPTAAVDNALKEVPVVDNGNAAATPTPDDGIQAAMLATSADASSTPALQYVSMSSVTPALNATPPGKLESTNYRAMSKRARALAKLDRLAGGNKSVFDADMNDIGALGIGMQLYFMLTKYLAITFFVMGMLSLPAIVQHLYGDGVTDSMADPLNLVYASLGNEGVSPEFQADTRMCLPQGSIDCNWTTVSTPFTSDPITVSWIITLSDVSYSVVFLMFLIVYQVHAKKAIENHANENLTPAKYAIYVRGLPPDAKEAEIVKHFNDLYDLTKPEEYNPLLLGCFWRRRRKVKMSLARLAVNRSTVQNLDHLAANKHATKDLYRNSWIAEVSIGHPSGGLLRTFLSMEALTKQIADTNELIEILEEEKQAASTNSKKRFRKNDELLLRNSKMKLEKLNQQMQRKVSKIKALKQRSHELEAEMKVAKPQQTPKDAKGKLAAASKAAKKAAAATQHELNWEACECAFIVFNNIESRRRCLHDYRKSTKRLARMLQPKLLRFRGKHRLIVLPAPEPSNILWENLEVTNTGRSYRRSLTNFLTFLLLLLSCMIISGAQSAQQVMKSKMVGSDFCDWTLPEVYYGNDSFDKKTSISWTLEWDANQTCPTNDQGKQQYHIGYSNDIVNSLSSSITNFAPLVPGQSTPVRCVESCISESSNRSCSSMACFNLDLQDKGEVCETYAETNILYCLCKDAISESVAEYGAFTGAKKLWADFLPCRTFITDYVARNIFMYVAAGIVVIVNIALKSILRGMSNFERHSSESVKASAIAMKLFFAQFLNTAVIVLLVNASLNLHSVPLMKDLFKGKYLDFERDWYPTVGMGITMTMLINVFVPQILLLVQMVLIAPLQRCLKRCKTRTQEQMNQLYAGPTFDISIRYPLVLNSVFVTMAFCGGSPVLLFIGALTAGGTYWFDKLSVINLYSVRTAYDEALGETAIALLPWTLVLHLGFSMWMYGNTSLMKSTTVQLDGLLKFLKFKIVDSNGNPMDADAMYAAFLAKISKYDMLGRYGFTAKIVNTNVMILFLFLVLVVLGLLLSTLLSHVVLPVLRRTLWILLGWIYRKLANLCCRCRRCKKNARRVHPTATSADPNQSAAAPPLEPQSSVIIDPPGVVIPEYTDYFRKTVPKRFRPDKQLGFTKNPQGELVRLWQEETVQHGIKRMAGEPMRTWEAMQAPVKSYAVEANSKYRLAVAEIESAIRAASFHLGIVHVPDEEKQQATQVDAALVGTEPITIAVTSTRTEHQEFRLDPAANASGTPSNPAEMHSNDPENAPNPPDPTAADQIDALTSSLYQ